MQTQALARIRETRSVDGSVVHLSNVVKLAKAGDVEVAVINGITFNIPRQRFSILQ